MLHCSLWLPGGAQLRTRRLSRCDSRCLSPRLSAWGAGRCAAAAHAPVHMGEACSSGAVSRLRVLPRAALWQSASLCARGAAPETPGLGTVLPGRGRGRPMRATGLLAARATRAGRSVRLRRQLPAEAATRPGSRPLSHVARALCGARLTPVCRRCMHFMLPGGRMLLRSACDKAQCVVAQQAAQLPVGLGDAGGNAGRQRADLPDALHLAARTQCASDMVAWQQLSD